MKYVRYSDLAVLPWKNGAGIRRDVAQGRLVDNSSAANDSNWLLSIADLNESTAFSEYPTATRWFLPITPGWVTLTFDVDGTKLPVELTEQSPAHEFSGGTPVQCTLHDGSMKALNVMMCGAKAEVSLSRERLTNMTRITLPSSPNGSVSFLMVAKGVCRVHSDIWSGPIATFNSLVNDSGLNESFEISPIESSEIVIGTIGAAARKHSTNEIEDLVS